VRAEPTLVRDEQRYPAPPADVLALLTDPAFLRDWADELGARVEDVSASGPDSGRRTEVRLRVPTRGIPPVFARFVGAEVTVRDVRTWRPDGDGGFTADTEVRATIFGRAAVVLGTSTLAADGSGTLATSAARVTVDAPVVGRQAENAVGELVAVVLRREAEVLRRRLADGGRASSTP
jgi:uncharacterized protein YndB with AHSA1/START domain